MKLFILLSLVCVASCDKFSEDEINAAQTQLIKDTIAKIQEFAKNKLTAIFNILGLCNDNLANMDKMMMEEADRCEQQGLPLIKVWFTNIHRIVYLYGRKTAQDVDLPYYTIKNSTDGQLALAKFAATAVVINWRCQLDQERRTVHPTPCNATEAQLWDNWHSETNQTITTLQNLVPKLDAAKSAFWAHQHQRMEDYIVEGVPKINSDIKSEPSEEKRKQYLCKIIEDLHLLNTVASSRPPGS